MWGPWHLLLAKKEFVRLCQGEQSTFVVCRNTDGRVALRPNKPTFFKGKGCKFKSFYSAQESALGGAITMLAESWADEVIEVQCISDRILLLKMGPIPEMIR